MNCAQCGLAIAMGEWVILNGAPYHVLECFAAGLRSKAFVPEDLEVALAPAMLPMVAYRAGKQFTAIIVAERRKAKKRRGA